ncbi:MAG: hypothetical protein P9X24_12650 [Candidatus Hatepunaea meridiana]|nr:hypothetical protein [Candidatus Hatepunaea meridiana]
MREKIIISILLMVTIAFAKPKTEVRWPIEHYDLTIRFDVDNHKLEGTAKLTFPRKGAKVAGFLLNKDFTISNVTLGGVPVDITSQQLDKPEAVSPRYGVFGKWDASDALLWTTQDMKKVKDKAVKKTLKKAFKAKPLVLQLDFAGSLYTPVKDSKFSREKIAFEVNGTIGNEGIYLSSSSYWYPLLPDILATHVIKTKLPNGWNCVTCGKSKIISQDKDWIEIEHRSDVVTEGIALSAAPFVVDKIDYNVVSGENTLHNVEILTYMLPAQANLSNDYLKASEKFIDMYSNLIAPYPFTKFAVVDNFVSTGYGMPGWTLLGSKVLRLPFIKDISLGHEIAHSWTGNSLFVDYREGNWCEGLTVYLADYKYKEDSDSLAALEYRKNLLTEYVSYVNPDNEYPVSEFVSRSCPADRAIGYGKAMMIFHMLRKMLNQIDKRIFNQVISETYNQYQWQPIGWSIWQREFERRLRQKLDWFYDQWLSNPGILEIKLENVKANVEQGRWELKFEVVTNTINNNPAKYLLPIRVVSETGRMDYNSFIQSSRQIIELRGGGDLRSLMLDPGYDVFRKTYPGEVPITLANFYGDKEGILVIPSQGANATYYKKVAEGLKSKGQRVVTDAKLTPQMKKQSLWLLGDPVDNKAWSEFRPDSTQLVYLPYRAARWKEEDPLPAGLVYRGEEFRDGTGFSVTFIGPHPLSEGKTIVYSLFMPKADILGSSSKLPHYGKYSYLMFKNDENIRKGVWKVTGKSPVTWNYDK